MYNRLDVTNFLLMGILCNELFAEPFNFIAGFLYLFLASIIKFVQDFFNNKNNGE